MWKQLFIFLSLFLSPLKGLAQDKSLTISAYWNGSSFQPWDLSNITSETCLLKEPCVYFAVKHIHVYGHGLIDGVIPLYSILKENALLNTPINLFIEVEWTKRGHVAFQNILQLIKDIFQIKEIFLVDKKTGTASLYVEKLIMNEHVPLANAHPAYCSFYQTCPDSLKYIHALKDLGLVDNATFQDPNRSDNLVEEFVRFVAAAYKIDLPMIKNRVLITSRSSGKKILNPMELAEALKKHGYDVVAVDFEKLPIQQQIVETIQSEYLIGTYGSNLVNAIFLKPEANVVILWHKHAKYFWSRRYCIIHSAFLSAGVKLIEYDQPNYDKRNKYCSRILNSDYFYRKKKINYLKEEKINLDAMVKYPLASMDELTQVDLYIEPNDIIKLLKNSKNSSQPEIKGSL